MEENKIYCSHCGELIENDDYDTVNGEPICQDCTERYTVNCDALVHEDDVYHLDGYSYCRECYDEEHNKC